MKKFLGINRNKLNLFQAAKLNNIKKKNRFKIAGKDEEDSITCNSSLTQRPRTPTSPSSPTPPRTPATKRVKPPRAWRSTRRRRRTSGTPTKSVPMV